MYDEQPTDNPPRPNRISFYVFYLAGGEDIGSYFQEPITAGERLHLAGTADGERTPFTRMANSKTATATPVYCSSHFFLPLHCGDSQSVPLN